MGTNRISVWKQLWREVTGACHKCGHRKFRWEIVADIKTVHGWNRICLKCNNKVMR